ncbi:hypothetical protein AMAG_02540 [Allomyces macrogynus ATCC 38327]|uniref:Dynein heavy chain linker domain-containing protein n=1 Tax=Allomyces macrogynus (strain ATCC 38327) TaxID=578462 RepID=A0A0L0S315_ALLM3|nr:hypothetical protein AMAG_02540 [Allomyces macrogynus ATCC 38327]|eukprot:KNE56764.1 hypothetical protein AMAG_02540 [Allomyces macrogynus ATCC 38327]
MDVESAGYLRIQWANNSGITKRVHRLNLQLDCEPPLVFAARVRSAHAIRAYQIARVDEWLQIVALQTPVPALPDAVRVRLADRILANTTSKLAAQLWAGTVLDPTIATLMWRDRVEECLQLVAWHWVFAMKQGLVFPGADGMFARDALMSCGLHRVAVQLPGHAIVTTPGALPTLTDLRNGLARLAPALVFPAAPASFRHVYDQICALAAWVDHEVRTVWRPAQLVTLTNTLYVTLTHQRLVRVADLIVGQVLTDLEETYLHGLAQCLLPGDHDDRGILDAIQCRLLRNPMLQVDLVVADRNNAVALDPPLEDALDMVSDLAYAFRALMTTLPTLNHAVGSTPGLLPTYQFDGNTRVKGMSDRLDRAIRHSYHFIGTHLDQTLTPCLWLLDSPTDLTPNPELDMAVFRANVAQFDTLLARLAASTAQLTSFDPTVRTRLIHAVTGPTLRALRQGARRWRRALHESMRAMGMSLVHHVLAAAHAMANTLRPCKVWRDLTTVWTGVNARLERMHDEGAALAVWWDVATAHCVPLDPDSSKNIEDDDDVEDDPDVAPTCSPSSAPESTNADKYWAARAVPRRMAATVAVTMDLMRAARAADIKRMAVLRDHVANGLRAAARELATVRGQAAASWPAPPSPINSGPGRRRESRAVSLDGTSLDQLASDAGDMPTIRPLADATTVAANAAAMTRRITRIRDRLARVRSVLDDLQALEHGAMLGEQDADPAWTLAEEPDPALAENLVRAHARIAVKVQRTAAAWTLVAGIWTQLAAWRGEKLARIARDTVRPTIDRWRRDVAAMAETHREAMATDESNPPDRFLDGYRGRLLDVVTGALDESVTAPPVRPGEVEPVWTETDAAGVVKRVAAAVLRDVDALATLWPVVYALCSPHLQMKHWFQITKRTGISAHDLELLTLDQVLALQLDLIRDVLPDMIGLGSSWYHSATAAAKPAAATADAAANDVVGLSGSLVTCAFQANSLLLEGPTPPGPPLWTPESTTAQQKVSAAAKSGAAAPAPSSSAVSATGKRALTVPYARIRGVLLRPPHVPRYLAREAEWTAYDVPDAAPWTQTLAGTMDDATAPLFPAIACGPHVVRRGTWHTKVGNVAYFLSCLVDETAGETGLEVQLMQEGSVGVLVEYDPDTVPFVMVVVTAPRGTTPETFCDKLESVTGKTLKFTPLA